MRERRLRAYRSGLFAETIAALLLRLKAIASSRGAKRPRSARSTSLHSRAFIEVKRRKTADDAASTRRIVRAAQYWLAGHPSYAGHDIALERGARGTLGLAALDRKRISRLSLVHSPLARLCL